MTTEIERIRAALDKRNLSGNAQATAFAEMLLAKACNHIDMQSVLAHIDQQQAEIERLRADAARYQWLREQNALLEDDTFYVGVDRNNNEDDIKWIGSDLDAAIDAAMKETP